MVWATLVRYSFIRFNFDFHNHSKYVYVIIYQELNLASIVKLTPAQLQLLLVKPFISSSSRLTVSAWVSPSSTPACLTSECQSVRNARIAYHLKINHLQASDHKTSLPNYYPFTLGNLRQLSNGHLSMQHLSWRHLSILAIYQLLLTRFWPNLKGKFLGPFGTYPNCHRHLSMQYLYWRHLSIWLIS